jgi:hypothetical protein
MPATTPIKVNKPLYPSAYHVAFVEKQKVPNNVFDFSQQNYSQHLKYTYKSKNDDFIENKIKDLKNKLSKLFLSFNKNLVNNPEYLSSFNKRNIIENFMIISSVLLLKNPSIISAEPTADDTLFFTAKYAEKTCYVEVYFEENEEPVCVLNIYEDKKIIINRVGTIQNVMNTFLSLENIAVV